MFKRALTLVLCLALTLSLVVVGSASAEAAAYSVVTNTTTGAKELHIKVGEGDQGTTLSGTKLYAALKAILNNAAPASELYGYKLDTTEAIVNTDDSLNIGFATVGAKSFAFENGKSYTAYNSVQTGVTYVPMYGYAGTGVTFTVKVYSELTVNATMPADASETVTVTVNGKAQELGKAIQMFSDTPDAVIKVPQIENYNYTITGTYTKGEPVTENNVVYDVYTANCNNTDNVINVVYTSTESIVTWGNVSGNATVVLTYGEETKNLNSETNYTTIPANTEYQIVVTPVNSGEKYDDSYYYLSNVVLSDVEPTTAGYGVAGTYVLKAKTAETSKSHTLTVTATTIDSVVGDMRSLEIHASNVNYEEAAASLQNHVLTELGENGEEEKHVVSSQWDASTHVNQSWGIWLNLDTGYNEYSFGGVTINGGVASTEKIGFHYVPDTENVSVYPAFKGTFTANLNRYYNLYSSEAVEVKSVTGEEKTSIEFADGVAKVYSSPDYDSLLIKVPDAPTAEYTVNVYAGETKLNENSDGWYELAKLTQDTTIAVEYLAPTSSFYKLSKTGNFEPTFNGEPFTTADKTHSVAAGGNYTLSIKPADGYYVKSVKIGDVDVIKNDSSNVFWANGTMTYTGTNASQTRVTYVVAVETEAIAASGKDLSIQFDGDYEAAEKELKALKVTVEGVTDYTISDVKWNAYSEVPESFYSAVEAAAGSRWKKITEGVSINVEIPLIGNYELANKFGDDATTEEQVQFTLTNGNPQYPTLNYVADVALIRAYNLAKVVTPETLAEGVTLSETRVFANETATVTVPVVEGYSIKSVSFSAGTSKKTSDTETAQVWELSKLSEDVTVTVNYEEEVPENVTVSMHEDSSEYAVVTNDGSAFENLSVAPGTKLSFKVEPIAKDGNYYYVKEVFWIEIENENENEPELVSGNYTEGVFTFSHKVDKKSKIQVVTETVEIGLENDLSLEFYHGAGDAMTDELDKAEETVTKMIKGVVVGGTTVADDEMGTISKPEWLLKVGSYSMELPITTEKIDVNDLVGFDQFDIPAVGVQFGQTMTIDTDKLSSLLTGGSIEDLITYGKATSHEIVVTYTPDSDSMYPAMTRTFTVTLTNAGIETKVVLNEGVSMQYTSKLTADDIGAALLNKVVKASDDSVITSKYSTSQFDTNASASVGTHTGTVKYLGDSANKLEASSASAKYTITQGSAAVNVNSVTQQYTGSKLDADEVLSAKDTITGDTVDHITVVAGINVTGRTPYIHVNLPEMFGDLTDLVNKLGDYAVMVPELSGPINEAKQIVASLNEMKTEDGANMSVKEMVDFLQNTLKVVEDIEAVIGGSNILGALDVDMNADALKLLGSVLNSENVAKVRDLLGDIQQLEGLEDVEFLTVFMNTDQHIMPKDAGVYVIGAVVADSNYNIAYDLDYAIIYPNATEATLDWNFEDDNMVVLLSSIDEYDFAAHITDSDLHEQYKNQIEYLFIGADVNGNTYFSNEAPTQMGAYTEISYVLMLQNNMIYAKPIVRPFVIVGEPVDVRFTTEERAFTYDGTAKYLTAEAYTMGGKLLTEEDGTLKLYYTGVETDGDVYGPTTDRPTECGTYNVTAIYVGNDQMSAGINTTTMLITLSGEAVIDVTSQSKAHDGQAVSVNSMVTSAPEDAARTIISGGVYVDVKLDELDPNLLTGTANVDFPARVDELLNKVIKDQDITVTGLLTGIDTVINTLSDYVDVELLKSVREAIAELPAETKLTFYNNAEYSEVGTYLVFAAITDPNYKVDTDIGYLSIYGAESKITIDQVTKEYTGNNYYINTELVKDVPAGAATTIITGAIEVDPNLSSWQNLNLLTGSVNIDFPETIDNIIDDYVKDEDITTGVARNTLVSVLDQISGLVESETLTEIRNAVQSMPADVVITFKDNPGYSNVGVYLTYGIVTDPYFQVSSDFGYLHIVGEKALIGVDEVTRAYNGKATKVSELLQPENRPDYSYTTITGGVSNDIRGSELANPDLSMIDYHLNIDFPASVDALLKDVVGNEITTGVAREQMEIVLDKLNGVLESELIDKIKTAVSNLPANQVITFHDDPAFTDVGFYVVFAAITDTEYQIEAGLGYLHITAGEATPKVQDQKLGQVDVQNTVNDMVSVIPTDAALTIISGKVGAYGDGLTALTGEVNINFPASVDALIEKLDVVQDNDVYTSTVLNALNELKALITKASDEAAAQIGQYVDVADVKAALNKLLDAIKQETNIDVVAEVNGLVQNVKSAIDQLPDVTRVTFYDNPTYSEEGVYLVYAIVTDPSYAVKTAQGYLIIGDENIPVIKKGTLTIVKTFEGLTDVPEDIEIVVTATPVLLAANAQVTSYPIKVGLVDGEYTGKAELPAGTYKLSETVTAIEGYTLATSYKVNGVEVVAVTVAEETDVKVDVTNKYTVAGSGEEDDTIVTVEIPFSKTVKKTGTKDPGVNTFYFYVHAFNETGDVSVKVVNETAQNFYGKVEPVAGYHGAYAITVNGASTVNGHIEATGTKSELPEYVIMYEVPSLDNEVTKEQLKAAGWTYDMTAFPFEYDENGEGYIHTWNAYITSGENGVCNVRIARTDDWANEKDSFTFVNTYSANEEVTTVPPQTGDDSNIALWLALCTMSAAGALLILRKKKEA